MLSEIELRILEQSLRLTPETAALIRGIRKAEPSRRIASSPLSVCVRYPSHKMGKTIQAESHKVALTAIYEMEHDPGVLEFYDQPQPVKLSYLSPSGRSTGTVYTPDFFVIRKDSIGWEEWRHEQDLIRLAESQPNRYILDADGKWHCPPGEVYAQQFGLSYNVHSSSEINWTLQRNLIFLDDYFDQTVETVKPEIRAVVTRFFAASPYAPLSDILNFDPSLTADDIFSLIAAQVIACDLRSESLAAADKFLIYRDEQTLGAYQSLKTAQELELPGQSLTVELSPGATFRWDGRIWIILNAGEKNISLRGENDTYLDLPAERFQDLLKQGKIEVIKSDEATPKDSPAEEILLSASPEDLAEANKRYELIKPYINGNRVEPDGVSRRTISRYLSAWKEGEQLYGNGFAGLIPKISGRGNRNQRLPDQTVQIINEYIEKDYETTRHGNMWSTAAKIQLKCQESGTVVPSYMSVVRAIRKRPVELLTRKREGRRAAYPHTRFHWELEQTTPRHGSRPFEVVHIDHTELDIELVSSGNSQNLGRPWLTIMIDAYSRRILAFHLTFDPPSYRSCMMILRECVRRHARLPQTIVVDNGTEFHSTFFESVLARFGIAKKSRPPAKARFGSVCERLFGVTNTQLIHNLMGNTQITREVRKVTKSVDPRNLATWTLPKLELLLQEWAYQFYETQPHPALHLSPRDAFDAGIAATGLRAHKMIPYNEEFIIFTCPSTNKGTAKVSPTHGIKVNGINYWSHEFRDAKVADTDVPVRYDPFDIGTAYAFVKGRWIKCVSEHYTDLKGRTERELKLATAEIRKQQKDHGKQRTLSAAALARFLRSAEAQEALSVQRMRDHELHIARHRTPDDIEATQDMGHADTEIAVAPTIDEQNTAGQAPRPPRILEDY